MPLLKPGSHVPDFTVAAHDGRLLSLADFVGKQPLVVFFYPRSGTPVVHLKRPTHFAKLFKVLSRPERP